MSKFIIVRGMSNSMTFSHSSLDDVLFSTDISTDIFCLHHFHCYIYEISSFSSWLDDVTIITIVFFLD